MKNRQRQKGDYKASSFCCLQESSPGPEHYHVRTQLIRRISDVVSHGLNYEAGMRIEPYGSFLSNLFTPQGDLDLAIEGSKYPQYETLC